MSIKLTKGLAINLKKAVPNLKRVLIGLGCEPVKNFFGFSNIDIDASIFCIDENGRCESIVYYGALTHRSGAIKHYGNNLIGDVDDEQIEIQLDKIPGNISRLAIIVDIYSAYSKHQRFGKVKNCFVHVSDLDSGKELVCYDVNGNFNNKTIIFVANLYRHNGGWKFRAIGEGVEVTDIHEMVAKRCN